jgi:hypothetical protein
MLPTGELRDSQRTAAEEKSVKAGKRIGIASRGCIEDGNLFIDSDPAIVVGQDGFDLFKTEVQPVKSRLPQQKLIAEMATLVRNTNSRRPPSGSPGYGDAYNIVGVDEVPRRCVQVELSEDSGVCRAWSGRHQ